MQTVFVLSSAEKSVCCRPQVSFNQTNQQRTPASRSARLGSARRQLQLVSELVWLVVLGCGAAGGGHPFIHPSSHLSVCAFVRSVVRSFVVGATLRLCQQVSK